MKGNIKAPGLEIIPGSHEAYDIRSCIDRLDAALPEGAPIPYLAETLTQERRLNIFICLDDLLQKARRIGDGQLRVQFTDDVQIGPDVRDVTDLINKARNAAAHISSPLRLAGENLSIRSIVSGKMRFVETPDFQLTSDYEDDIAIFFGKYRIYLFRHVYRAFREVKEKLLPLITRQEEPWPDIPFGG